MKDARARLSEIAEDARSGQEKIITRNGESYVAVIDARRLDHYHRLERELIHLTLLPVPLFPRSLIRADDPAYPCLSMVPDLGVPIAGFLD
ncbi:MAG: type II toxin-antitoxin system prevent-host-death family antitoxin [Xanthomonadales bacterium]|nr:type II toxin-antitoxin system prevent-host-death family antitoxin [Xanthomonadales bacterium]